jgi:hypothetical protein
VFAVVECEMCRTVRAKSLFVVTFCKNLITAITILNPVYSHKRNSGVKYLVNVGIEMPNVSLNTRNFSTVIMPTHGNTPFFAYVID